MIKKTLFLLLLAANLNMSAQQTTYDLNESRRRMSNNMDLSKIQFGFKITPAIGWIDVVHNDLQADGAALKFGVGCVASYPLLPFLSFVSGLEYNGYGGYVYDNASLNDPLFQSSYKLNYTEIKIPLALRLQTEYFNNTSYFIQGGFSVGFLTGATEKYFAASSDNSTETVHIEMLTNPTRVGYQLGAGLEYAIGRRTNIFGLISYNSSISNVANTTNYQTNKYPGNATPVQILPGSMEFSIGIMF